MRPLLKTLVTLSLPALLASASLGVSSCAVDGCEIDPTDPRCVAAPSSDLTLVTSRLPKAGGRLLATIKNHQAASKVEATLGTSGPRVNFTLDQSSGMWGADISSSVLADIPLGPLLVTLFSDNKTLTKTLHVYASPSYSDSTRASLNITNGRAPTWVQVSQGHIFATLDNATDRRVFEYQVTGTTITALSGRDSLVGIWALSTIFDVSETSALQLSASGAVTSLTFAALDSSVYNAIKPTLTYTKLGAMAVDRQNMGVAVAGEGTDGPLKVFTVSQSPTSAIITNAPSSKLAVQLAWGRIDNDTQTDLVALHSDGTFAVYLQKATTGLTYDQTFSAGLQTAAALQATGGVSIAIGDVDRDGLDDVMIAQNMQVWQLASEGNGTFIKTSLFGGIPTDAIAVGDVTGDSLLDIVVAAKSPATLYAYPSKP